MALSSTTTDVGKLERVKSRSLLVGGLRFDFLMAALALLLIGGLFLDGWAHNHGRVDNTFFTPWHAVLYGSMFLNGIVLGIVLLLNLRRGASWREALPAGYALSFLGCILFVVGGVGDIIWHQLFGFELGIEPLLSPTHLELALSGFLIFSGPVRSGWIRADKRQDHRWLTLFPVLVSLAALISVFTFFISYSHFMVVTYTITDPSPLSNPAYLSTSASTFAYRPWGATGIMLTIVIIMGVLLFALRRWRLPIGSFTLILTLNVALMSVMKDKYELIMPAFISGVIIDVLYASLQPSVKRPGPLRLFAFSAPFVYTLAILLTIIILWGTYWSVHLWLGISILAGVIGLLLSYLVAPPALPAHAEE